MWTAFENGATLGQNGSDQSDIVRDDEHSLGARITLERNSHVAPFAITCGIYGWMVHTRFFESEDEANTEYEKMKTDLAELVSQISRPDFGNTQATEAIETFVKTYP